MSNGTTHITWAVVAAILWAGPAAMAVDELNLRTDKAELDSRLAGLEANQRKMREKAGRSAEVSAARKAIDEARKAQQRQEAADPALAEARQAEKDAREKLAGVVEAKLAATRAGASGGPAGPAVPTRGELDYREALLRFQLEHEGSPIRLKLDADVQAAALAARADALDREAAARPSDEVRQASLAVQRAAMLVAPLEAQVATDARAVAAARALAEASDARNAVRSADPKLADVEKAKQAWQAARLRALEPIGEARDLLDQRPEIDATKREIDGELRANAELLAVLGQTLSPRTYPEVASARARLVNAQVAIERAMRQTGLARLRDNVQTAQQARDGRIDSLLKDDKEFQGMLAKYAALAKRIAVLNGRIESLTRAEAIELAEARAAHQALHGDTYKYRQRYWDHPTVEPLRMAAHGPYQELGRRMKSTPAVAQAEADCKAAGAALEAVQEEALAGERSSRWALDERSRLRARRAAMQFREAIVRHKLEARGSPLGARADADPEVAAALNAWRDSQQAEREQPSPAVAAADKALADAKAAQESAMAAHAEYQRALAYQREMVKALQSAERADPRRKAASDARKARDELRAARLASLPEGRELLAEREAIAAGRKVLDAVRRGADAELDALRKKLEAGGDAQTAGIVQEVEAARKAVKAIEGEAAREQIEAREKAVETKIDALLATDRDYQTVVGEIDAVKRELGGVEERLRRIAR